MLAVSRPDRAFPRGTLTGTGSGTDKPTRSEPKREEEPNMKKMLVASVVAVALMAGLQQQASAWCKFNFGVGLNCSYEGGGNSLLWGLIKGSPCPNQMGIDPGLGAPLTGGYNGHTT